MELPEFVKEFVLPFRTNLGKVRENLEDVANRWDELKIKVACSGLRTTTHELEMERLEHGQVLVDGMLGGIAPESSRWKF